jgi:hypothetical protein
MVMSPERIEELLNTRNGRTGLIDEKYRWTDNIVPYQINPGDFSKFQYFFVSFCVNLIQFIQK